MSISPSDFSPSLARLQERARALLKNKRCLHEPMFADADAVTAWVSAIGQEIDALHEELTALREEIRNRDAAVPVEGV